MGVPPSGWSIVEIQLKWTIWGDPYFRKPPYNQKKFNPCFTVFPEGMNRMFRMNPVKEDTLESCGCLDVREFLGPFGDV